MWWTHISQTVADPHVRGNDVIQYVVDLQVIEMQAMNSPVSYGHLTVDRELEF